MNIDNYKINSLGELLKANSYPGRGIVCGLTADGKKAVLAYFIMGRSENSRNRVFVAENDAVTIYPFDASKVEDPSLIIYSPLRKVENKIVLTNGDQTDTIYEFLKDGKTSEEALATRCFEPDAPNYTPRISAVMTFPENCVAASNCGDCELAQNCEKTCKLTYQLSILKSMDADGKECARYFYNYTAEAGLGHFIHTYEHDDNPLPTFLGEPRRVAISNNIDEFAGEIWDNLDVDNKISLFVRFVNLEDGKAEDRLVNKNK